MHGVKEFVNNNKGILAFATLIFVAGIVFGTVVSCSMSSEDGLVLKQQLSGYVTCSSIGSVTFGKMFASRCINSLKYVLIMAVCAQHIIFLPGAAVCLGIKAYQLGFALSFICGNFATGDILAVLMMSVFLYVAFVPYFVLVFVMVVSYVLKHKKRQCSQRKDFCGLLALLAVVYAVQCICACAEAFFIPLFAQWLGAFVA